MKARELLLKRLRAQGVAPVPLPELDGEWLGYADRVGQFREALALAAGQLIEVAAGSSLAATIAHLPELRKARSCHSFVPGVPGTTGAQLPREFERVEVVVAAGRLGVAENGAVWVDEELVPVRAALFLAQHLVLVLARTELVDNLHQAYTRLGARVGQTGYGCFISGPSKTADIEQSLVIGAHGPRTLSVVLHG